MRPVVEPGPELTRAQLQRYSRHILLGPIGRDGQRRLLQARVAVVGAGGLGAPVIQYLAAAGIGRLTVIDDDVVEASNLQRQVIHSQATLGRPKVSSAAETASALNPDVTVTARQVRLEQANAAELLGGHDLVIDGTDNFPTRYLISDVCAELGLPVVWGSILRFDAQVSVFWASEQAEPTVTLRDLFPHPPDEGTTLSCGEAGVLGAMCGQVGSVMATEAIKLLTGAGQTLLGRILVLDALTQRWREIPLQPPAAPRDERPRAALAADPPPEARIVEDPPAEVPAIDVLELQRRLAARDRSGPSTVLIDVREAPEREIAVIPGAVHVPLEEILRAPAAAIGHVLAEAERDEAGHDGPPEVLVHCRSGQRSARAVVALRAAGIPAVTVAGGILAWGEQIDPTLARY